MKPTLSQRPEAERQTVKITEFYDNPNQISIVDATCLTCGVHMLHREEKNGFVTNQEIRDCNCPLLPS